MVERELEYQRDLERARELEKEQERLLQQRELEFQVQLEKQRRVELEEEKQRQFVEETMRMMRKFEEEHPHLDYEAGPARQGYQGLRGREAPIESQQVSVSERDQIPSYHYP